MLSRVGGGQIGLEQSPLWLCGGRTAGEAEAGGGGVGKEFAQHATKRSHSGGHSLSACWGVKEALGWLSDSSLGGQVQRG